MTPNCLTSLFAVRQWLLTSSSAPTTDDALTQRLITAASGLAYGTVNRASFPSRLWTETYNPVGQTGLMLRQWPVTGVSALSVAGSIIPPQATPPFGSGYQVDLWGGVGPGAPSFLVLPGCRFPTLPGGVTVTYRAGYLVAAESWVVPATPYKVAPVQPAGSWASDAGVVYGDTGLALAAVTTAPTVGQYQVLDTQNADGTVNYLFAAVDVGRPVLISYGYVPSDVEGAVIQMVGEVYRKRDRIGQISKSLGGQETVSYEQVSIGKTAMAQLSPYRQVMSA